MVFRVPAAQNIDTTLLGGVEVGSGGQAYESKGITLSPANSGGKSIDDGGVFYYMGTSGRRYTFRNPAALGIVKFTSSEVIANGSLESLASRDVADMWTMEAKDQWLEVDLGTARLDPTHYCLQHGGKEGHLALRHWVLEAYSELTHAWCVLRQHVDDTSLAAGPYTKNTWPLPREDATCVVPTTYHKLRVRLTGPNQSCVPRPQYRIQLCGIELYGVLYL